VGADSIKAKVAVHPPALVLKDGLLFVITEGLGNNYFNYFFAVTDVDVSITASPPV